MEDTLFLIGLLFVVKIATGFWLRRAGRLISTALLTGHKLVALGTLAALIVYIRPLLSDASPLAMAAAAAAGLLFLASIVTGGLVSLAKPAGRLVAGIHLVAPVLVVIATVLTISMLVGR